MLQFLEFKEEFYFNQLTPEQQQEYNRCLDGTIY